MAKRAIFSHEDFSEWTQKYKSYYNLKGWSYENYSSYYENTYRNSFDSYVETQDRNQAAEDALGKMWFLTFMMSTAGSMGMGTLALS